MSRVSAPGVPTPIRAITTPLRSSAAPPIPPAAQLYEPLAKAVLRKRLTGRIFPYTFLLALASTALTLLYVGGFGLTRLLGAGAALWLGGVLPVVVVRKAWLTVTRTSAPSPHLLLQKSLAPPLRARTSQALQAHLVSALLSLAVHAALDDAVPVVIRSRKHPYTPHPVLVLLALGQCVLASLYVLRAILRDVWVFPFRRPTLTPAPGAVLAPAFLALAAPLVALVVLFVVVPVLRWVPGVSLLLRPIRHPHLSVLRALPRAWVLGLTTAWTWEGAGGVWAWAIGEPLYTTPSVRALVSGISVALTPAPAPPSSNGSSAFSTPGSGFGTPARTPSYLAQSHSSPFSAPSASAPTPSAGAPSEPSIYTHLAYAELLALATAPEPHAPGRAEAFDVEGAGGGGVWARLVREGLVLLGREYRVLLARGGAPPSPPLPPSPPAATLTPSALPPTPSGVNGSGVGVVVVGTTPLRKENIFAKKTAPASPAARVGSVFASGDMIEGIVGPVVGGIAPPATSSEGWHLGKYVHDFREVMRDVAPVLPMSGHARVVVGLLDGALWAGVKRALFGGAAGGGEGRGGGGIWGVWTMRRRGREVAGWVPRREVVAECVEVLTHLTCASLTEDRYGVVQRDIPRVLEALVAFLVAVEEAQAGLRPSGALEHASAHRENEDENENGEHENERGEHRENEGGKPKMTLEARRAAEAEAADLEEARAVLGEVGDALRDGLARIARTFGDKLRAFRFAPRTAARLQGFMEWA
ncbi:hypothetical protein DFH06DRAFT_717930 [Mycena polygramma]|nr:hypothetical protein DFH06DRAFT_717930 [Mycena polygramma]